MIILKNFHLITLQRLINLGYDNFLDGSVATASIDTVTILDVQHDSIVDLIGIEDFTALTSLKCYDNLLSSLDVSQNTALTTLICALNVLTCLNISNNIALEDLVCENNLLEQLNTKNGFWASGMDVYANNNNLTCVEVDNLGYANTNWATTFDSFVTFSTNCNYTNPCNSSTSIQEHILNKDLLKVTDLLGRETKGTKNEVFFYIYDDGTVEKKIVIE